MTKEVPGRGALHNLRVLEITSVVSGPSAGKYLADFGADVIKVEPPGGDGTQKLGWLDPADDVSLFYKLVNRGKRVMQLDLKSSDGIDTLRKLLEGADVLIENLRPGKLERLGLDPLGLLGADPRLVVLRLSGFGQTGPMAGQPGFATTAEALSGLAGIMGDDSGPSLPPIALTDELAGLAGAFAVVVALHEVAATGRGQVVDVSLLESILQILGPLPAAWASLGYLQPRLRSGLPYSVPRGVYQTLDHEWLAVSTSAEAVAQRVLSLLGLSDPGLRSFEGRYAQRSSIEDSLRSWVAERTLDDAISELRNAQAAVAPVLDMRQVAENAQVTSRDALVVVDGVLMQAPIARLSATPAVIRHGVRTVLSTESWLDHG